MEEKPAPQQRNKWGQERRLDFIEFRLLWEGRINRSDLTDFFGVSMPQASADLANYIQLAPQNLAYDGSEKVYKATADFNPIRSNGTTQQFLLHLLALEAEGPNLGTSFIGWPPPYEVIGAPRRFIRRETLIAVLSAIRNKSALEIEYQSLTRPAPTKRWITPTVIVNDEFRWHVRAWCHTRQRYADFVFGRMLQTFGTRPQEEPLPKDSDWNTLVTLVIHPNPELTEAQRRAAELDYEMRDGKFEMSCRKALVFYLLRRLRLDEGSDLPKARQLVLMNRDEVMAAAGETSDYPATERGKETKP